MSGILGIGLRSMIAYQNAIQLTAQNLSNKNTPFYSRREIQFVNDMFNNGVTIGNAARVYDDVVNENLIKSDSSLGRAKVLFDQVSGFEQLLDNDKANINKFINDSLTAVQDLTTSVSSSQSRQAYLTQLSNIADRFRQLGANIQDRKEALNNDFKNTTQQVNSLIDQIASLNDQALHSEGTSIDAIQDQRNSIVHKLAEYISFSTSTDSHGVISISLSNGYSIVSNATVNHFSLRLNSDDTSKYDLYAGSGTSLINATNLISSGQLSGMLAYRNDVLDVANNGLNKLSLAFSQTLNQQNKLGVDLSGNLGGNIFSDINSAGLQSGRVIANLGNVGSGAFAVNIANVSQLTASDYKLVFSDATHYSMIRLSDKQSVSSGVIGSYPATISADGFSMTISSGAFTAGDSFLIRPTSAAMQHMDLLIKDPNLLALGYPVSAERSLNNLGQGAINVDSIVDTTNSSFSTAKQLNPPITIQFLTDTTYQIVNANTSAVLEGPLTYNPNTKNNVFPTAGAYDPGYRISITGTVKAGDTFNINYNTNVSADNRNALQFNQLYTAKVLDNGGSTFSEGYRSVSLGVSSQSSAAKTENDTAGIIHSQAEDRFYEISGVSDLEEVTNLAEYQKALQASAQIVQVAKTIFDTIISLSR